MNISITPDKLDKVTSFGFGIFKESDSITKVLQGTAVIAKYDPGGQRLIIDTENDLYTLLIKHNLIKKPKK